MGRIDEECIMYIGRNRSGIDSGEIDYGILVGKFESLKMDELYEALRYLQLLAVRVQQRMSELKLGGSP